MQVLANKRLLGMLAPLPTPAGVPTHVANVYSAPIYTVSSRCSCKVYWKIAFAAIAAGNITPVICSIECTPPAHLVVTPSLSLHGSKPCTLEFPTRDQNHSLRHLQHMRIFTNCTTHSHTTTAHQQMYKPQTRPPIRTGWLTILRSSSPAARGHPAPAAAPPPS